jgi:hypothetical protein
MQTTKKTHPASRKAFLRRVLPYPIFIGIVEAIAAAVIFATSPESLRVAESNTLVIFSFIVSGFIFFALE